MIKALSSYVYTIKDLRNANIEDVHGTRLKFYIDKSLDEKVTLSHVLLSETGMMVSKLLRLVNRDESLYDLVHCKGLSNLDDRLEPLSRMHEDVRRIVSKLLERKNSPAVLRARMSKQLGLLIRRV